jgi:hypothetical protein
MWNGIKQQTLKRTALMLEHSRQLSKEESANLIMQHFKYERDVFISMKGFAPIPVDIAREADVFYSNVSLPLENKKRLLRRRSRQVLFIRGT